LTYSICVSARFAARICDSPKGCVDADAEPQTVRIVQMDVAVIGYESTMIPVKIPQPGATDLA